MRIFILLISLNLIASLSCKTKHEVVKKTTIVPEHAGNTLGKVSHQFSSSGCSIVVIIKKEQDNLILLPKDILPKEYDIDGLELYFNYRLLKMKNSDGCNDGLPAQLTDILKK